MIAELEDGMLTRLRAAFGIGQTNGVPNGTGAQGASPLPYKVLTIDSYGGQLDIGDDGRPQAQQGFRMPAVFVTFAKQRQTKREGERTALQQLQFVVYCVTQNARNERATRKGDANEVGSFQLAEDVVQLLVNQSFGVPGARPAVLDEIESVFSSGRNDGAKAISIMAVHLTCAYHMRAAPSDCHNVIPTAKELHNIASGFYLQPRANQGTMPDASAVVSTVP
jgi:phage gp37-like protein